MKAKSFLFLLAVVVYFSCSPDDILTPSREFPSSLYVTVKDHEGLPVNGAQILIGDQSGTTDEYGTCFFTQVTLTGDDFVKAEKAGYFKGSRRFSNQEAHTQFVRITLLPHKQIGSFNSSQSEVISIDNKSKMIFPPQALANKDGSPYNGHVNVMGSPIYGDDTLLSEKMPGALVGQDGSGKTVSLGSFGMLAVELQDLNGEVLEIAPGKTVEVHFAVSDQQLEKAPPSIPLWYFDEVTGKWIEEGEAELQGNVYIAQLPHFSFWNWDLDFAFINWEAKYIYRDGTPAQNTKVCLTIKSLNEQRCTYTNSEGIASGPVPGNEAIILSIINECGTPVFEEEVGPFRDDTKMEARIVDVPEAEYATISGTARQCDGAPVTSGFVKIRTPLNSFIFPITGTEGQFDGSYIYCQGDLVTLYVYDVNNALVSPPHVITFDRNLNLDGIKSCNQLDEYLRYSVTGFSQEFVYYFPEVKVNHPSITQIKTLDSIGVKGKFAFTFDGVTIGQYTGYPSFGNQINLPNGQKAYITTLKVNVIEFGDIQEYVIGVFNGKINAGGNGAGGSGPSDFSGSFSVKRKE